MDPRPFSPPPTAPAFWSGSSSTSKGQNLNPAVWQGISGSPIGSSLSPPIARPSCSPRGNDTAIAFPSMSKTSATDCGDGALLETADLMLALNRPECTDGSSRHEFRIHQDSRRPRTRTLGETLLRGTRSDPNLAGRRHLYEMGSHYTPVFTPIPSTLATALTHPTPVSQRPVRENSKSKPLREAKGVQTEGEKLSLNHPPYQERSRSFSRSISNLFRRAYHEPMEKTKTSPRPRRMTFRGTAEESKASRALQQKSQHQQQQQQQQREKQQGAGATGLGVGVGASPCFTPSVWSFESSEDDGHVNIAARSGTLRLKKLFVWKGNQESVSSPDGSLKKQRGHCGLPTSDSPQTPIPPPHALAHSTFDVTMGSGISSPNMPAPAGPNSVAARAGGTRRRMNTLLSIMSPTRRSRLTPTVLIEPPNSAPLPLLDPTSHTPADGEPLTPPADLPLRVPRDVRSKWSDSSAGEEESASTLTAKASQKVAEQATDEAEEVWEPSRRSSDLLAKGWSFSARDASEEEEAVFQCSIEDPPRGETTMEPTTRCRDPSDSSVYADPYEETARDAVSTLQRTREGSDTMEIIGSDDVDTSEHTLVEATTTTDAMDLSSDQDDVIHFTVEEEAIPSHPIWHSDSQSEVSSGNHFYDVSFGTTSPSSHGHQQSLHAARQPSLDFRERPLPPLPTMGEMIRPSSSLRDIRGQASTLPLENRTNYLIPRCPCCGGSGRRELNTRCTSHCQQLPLLLPTSPRTPTSGNTSWSGSGPSTPKSAAFLIALPTVPSPPPKRRASFAIRRSALSCDPHGPLFRYKDLEGGLPGPDRMGRSISTLAIRERAAVTAKNTPAVDSYSMF